MVFKDWQKSYAANKKAAAKEIQKTTKRLAIKIYHKKNNLKL